MAQPILYVHGIEAIGGAERDLLLLLCHLDRNTWTPRIACPARGAFRARVESLKIPISPLELPPWRKLSSLFSRYAASRRLRHLLKEHQPALVHVNDLWWVPHVVHAVKGMKLGATPVVAHVRQAIRPEKVRLYALDQVDYAVAVSRQVRNALEQGGVRSEGVKTLYSGVDLSACSPDHDQEGVRTKHGIPFDALVLGTVGNLLPIKGYEIMIEALPAVREKVSSVHYLILGGGTDAYVEKLRRLCANRGLVDRVHFAGFQDPAWTYLAAMDLYVQPSLNEALGIAAIEAMAMGKAVVATRVGGLPEVVGHEETGLLVTPGDAEELSRAVIALLRDPQRRERLGAKGSARAHERFDLKTAVAGIEQVYRDVLADRVDRCGSA